MIVDSRFALGMLGRRSKPKLAPLSCRGAPPSMTTYKTNKHLVTYHSARQSTNTILHLIYTSMKTSLGNVIK